MYSTRDVPIEDNGYPDLIAKADVESMRAIPWENQTPLFMVDFLDPKTSKPLPYCPRGLLKRVVEIGKGLGVTANVGIEYEFFNFAGGYDPTRRRS